MKKDLSIELLRHQLGSIDLSDVDEEKPMSSDERKKYCSQIFSVFDLLEKDIKQMLYQQLMYSSNQADTWEKVIFGRGTFNGMDLLLEKWKIAVSEAKELPETLEEPNSPVAEI